ncbi:alpha-crystallin A chain-like [Mizuhopecten yessoensis]|uniref:Alpha-crystallin B chain n=1 Tax=Mizuhopecten yessoensis TaxID=6573 RepID=A0A210QNI7_MIZYE|nr:alpha-crystallin A chain-like [Mizuhopecten yessoensis]OWF50282.1 Alpha-crystallin B chain [Mizuhopecten yessoensis]
MYRARSVVPRLCRHVQAVARQPLCCQSNIPKNSFFRPKTCRDPWDSNFNRGHSFDKHFRSILDEMGQMTRLAFGEIVDEIPRRGRHVLARSEAAELKVDKKAFSLKMNMRDFEQKNVMIKIDKDRLVISAKQENAENSGCVSREITREFLIPENIDTETMNAVVTDDGLLMVRGRIKGVTEEMEKVIEIDRQP